MLNANDRAKIQELYQEICVIYRESVARPSGNVCDLCGAGDKLGKNGFLYKVRSIVHGYEHRAGVSPKLCHRHASGWAVSYIPYNFDLKRTDEEIDLHFAKFLAKNLSKAANQRSNEPIL